MFKRCVRKIQEKTAKIEIERKRRNELPNRVDPDEMDHISHLIWIYTVCPAILFSRLDSTLSLITWTSLFQILGKMCGIVSFD